MLDYRGIEALYTVQQTQSFELAAQRLHLSQSAVSQRIKGLETHYGEPLLIRTLPYSPTPLGERLIGHFKQICLLEDELEKELGESATLPSISIALNRDSLETWFLDLIAEQKLFGEMSVEIVADDQELTLNYLKNGLVSACLSTTEKEISGGRAHFLGEMEYVLAASPSFVEAYFSKGSARSCLRRAPAIKFDQNDRLHERYLEKFFSVSSEEVRFYVVPSVRGFKQFVLYGYGYALIPKIDIHEELKKGKLVQLYPGKVWKIPLYWHFWSVQSKLYRAFNLSIVHHASEKLTRSL
ncbi:MAG: HTH-type transcriptional regulator ArgP [Chlamydiales bacterium]|nr:HTH-type transcriptional regulator ArgP [Chlamydiales bacterium]